MAATHIACFCVWHCESRWQVQASIKDHSLSSNKAGSAREAHHPASRVLGVIKRSPDQKKKKQHSAASSLTVTIPTTLRNWIALFLYCVVSPLLSTRTVHFSSLACIQRQNEKCIIYEVGITCLTWEYGCWKEIVSVYSYVNHTSTTCRCGIFCTCYYNSN